MGKFVLNAFAVFLMAPFTEDFARSARAYFLQKFRLKIANGT